MNLNLYKRALIPVLFPVTKCAMALLLLIASSSLYAQFTVNAVPTPDTCNGNGSLALSVQNAAPGATINYIVYYLGPTGTSTPVLVWNNSSPNVPGQQDGMYTVEAHQSVNDVEIFPFATTPATIANNEIPFDFTLTGKPILCGNDGEITATITSGTGVSYKLTAANGTNIGPQASPVFTGLAHNVLYTVLVTNNCGQVLPHSITLFEAIPTHDISAALFPDVELASCDELTIRNDIYSTNGVPITYPLQAKFTVTHYDGTVNIYDVAVPSGDPTMAAAQTVVDYHYGENCHYNVVFTNTCGTTFTSPELAIDPKLTINGEMVIIKCNGRNIKYTPGKYVGPFTLEFVNPPAGFNPADYNAQYPGPYTAADVPILFGDEDTPLPEGIYTVKIHDQCDRTPDAISPEISIELPEVEIGIVVSPAGCNTGGSLEAIIPGLPIGVGTMVSGPPEFSTTYGVDLDQYIMNKQNKLRDKIQIADLPPGEYFIVLKDTCGREYPGKAFTILPYNGDSASYLARPDCQVGFGTIQVSGANLEYIEMTAAPAAFSSTHPLPYDVSAHVNGGSLYMNGLPPGQYKFKAHNDCDDDILMNPNGFWIVSAYTITTEVYNLIPHCGSFDLFINHQSTGTAFVGFYLQKWDETLGQWRHPDDGGNVYVQGEQIVWDPDLPLADRTALKLTNNATNFNLLYSTGKYRVVKQYQTFGDGEKGEDIVLCTPTLYEFEYYSDLTITGAVSLDCMGSSGNVQINAFGVPPLTYSLISPTFIDNGENNIFTGLTSGVYTVEVKDQCGHTQPLTFNVADIPSLVHAPDPSDLDSMEACDQNGDNLETFNISGYTPIILDGQNPDDVTITYHTSQNDAEDGTNPIPDPTNVSTGTTTIYARATHILNADCAAITSFNITVNPMPVLTMQGIWGGCEGQDVTIIADSGFDYYKWTDATGVVLAVGPESITVSDEGSYTVVVRDDIGCEGSKTIEVLKSPVPVIHTVTIKDWSDQDNSLTVVMEPTTTETNYQYSLDNVHFQNSPVFNNLPPGQYTVYVKDKFGCGQDEFETYILSYPRFFTPNGDGENEYWRIYLAALEPDMLVYIYDRFGKLITGFGADSKGWDGTFNGARLPATDYWFVVKRQNGQELKGHFSMIR